MLFEILTGPKTITATDLQQNLMEMEYTHEDKKHPKFLFTFSNVSGKIFNAGVLLAGLRLKVRFGYENLISRPFIAPIRRVAALSLGEPGRSPRSPRPDVYGRVRFEAKALHWPVASNPADKPVFPGGAIKVSDAVRQIARGLGYKEKNIYVQEGLANTGIPEPILTNLAPLDIETAEQFLNAQAERRGFDFFVTDTEFHFHAKDWNQAVVETISYFKGPDLIDYSIDGDFNMSMTAVTAKSIDPYKVEPVAIVIGSSGAGAGVIQAPTGKRSDVTPKSIAPSDTVMSISSRAAEKAARRLVNHIKNRWKLNMTLVGNPRIFKGTALQLHNFGPLIDGIWFVEGVSHKFTTSDGYRTTLKASAKKAAKGFRGPVIPLLVRGADGSQVGTVSTGQGDVISGLGRTGKFRCSRRGRRRSIKPLKLVTRRRRR